MVATVQLLTNARICTTTVKRLLIFNLLTSCNHYSYKLIYKSLFLNLINFGLKRPNHQDFQNLNNRVIIRHNNNINYIRLNSH